MKLSAAIFFAAAAMLALATSATAVDGTIEINQAKVMAAGGFPYVISTASTSYRLTGSLTVPSGKDGIDVNAAHITIDLNGFSIVGPGSSSATPIGVNATGQKGITVQNGTLTGFGYGAAVGFFGIVKNVHADANANGIQGGNNTVIEGCTANNSTTSSTTGFGIYCAAACTITGNTTNGNPFAGIQCAGNGCVISGNTAIANDGFGIECLGSVCLISGNTIANDGTGINAHDATTGYGGNVLYNDTNVLGGSSLGNNLCSGSVC